MATRLEALARRSVSRRGMARFCATRIQVVSEKASGSTAGKRHGPATDQMASRAMPARMMNAESAVRPTVGNTEPSEYWKVDVLR